MTAPQFTIPKGKTAEPALDHRQLYALGLRHVQRLAEKVWTDHNIHDPGITTLELLCYALTDLAYRASWPVEDLLASASDNPERMERQFFTARQILPNRPLTENDYRKILIDIEGVKNAWLEEAPQDFWLDRELWELTRQKPAQAEKITVNGCYRVRIDFDDRINRLSKGAQKKRQNEVLEEVRTRLHANRNLCQDFVGWSEVQTQEFTLCARIDLAPDADTAQVAAEVEFRVRHYLAPTVRRYTLGEMLGRTGADGSRYTVDRIFEGPTLAGGFIDDLELQQAKLREEILLSDIISIIMDIPGVLSVPQIAIRPTADSTPQKKALWRVPVVKGRKAILSDTPPLGFFKRNMPVEPREDDVQQRLAELEQQAGTAEARILDEDIPVPLGRYRNVGSFRSFQNDFPEIYGLGEAGLDGTATPARRAAAWQLKGYLLFFDQLMANYLAQLRHVKDLLSVNSTRTRSYFSTVVDSFRDYLRIYRTEGEQDALLSGEDWLRKRLADIVESDDTMTKRRNRFLDHLLARFAERFTDYAHLMYDAFGAGGDHMIPQKRLFLARCATTGSERGLAFNYRKKSADDLWETDNVSGYERRLALLLGLDPRRRRLSRVERDEWTAVEETEGGDFRFVIRHRTSGETLLSGAASYATRDEAETALLQAIFRGKFAGHYRKIKNSGKTPFTFALTDEDGKMTLAETKRKFDRPRERDEAITDLMEYLRSGYNDEGMYVIEHILLLPDGKDDPFLPVCRTDGQIDEEMIDPYSYRMHVVLPGYTSRFANLAFRRYAEEVIRQETPAHILPKICWISREKMEVLEDSYRDWLLLKNSADTSGRTQKILKFIYSLLDGKNVYPQRTLHCGAAGDETPKFLLNRTSLGSGEDI